MGRTYRRNKSDNKFKRADQKKTEKNNPHRIKGNSWDNGKFRKRDEE